MQFNKSKSILKSYLIYFSRILNQDEEAYMSNVHKLASSIFELLILKKCVFHTYLV